MQGDICRRYCNKNKKIFIISKQNTLTNAAPIKEAFHSGVKRESTMQTSLRESPTSHCPVPRLDFNLHHQLNGFPSVQDKS